MSRYTLVAPSGRTAIQFAGPAIKSGGEGDIFRVAGYAGSLAKIYHGRNTSSRFNRRKTEAMIARPPEQMSISLSGTRLPLFAWPTHIIEDASGQGAGFMMTEIPTDRAVTLSKYMSRQLASRHLSDDDRCLERRFRLCRNLAAAIAELHRQNHYFVDLKPENIFMFKDTGIVCLIDNDGFSIDGGSGERFPAQTYTSQYLAPELLCNKVPPGSVGDDLQDRFALAALMFQILNNGLHPFQGTPLIHTEEWNIDYCVRNGYYPHGLQPHAAVAASRASVHDCLDVATRTLFDRAFIGPQPTDRPTALEWRDHFDQYAQAAGRFQRCSRQPTQVTHIHLVGMDCPECRLAELGALTAPPTPPKGGAQNDDPLPPPEKGNWKWLLVIAAPILFFLILAASNS